ncbi:MAG: thioredoxin family protein [Akkermansia sp.]|nr:thioredoxin family protein [Akkermansia sp.]
MKNIMRFVLPLAFAGSALALPEVATMNEAIVTAQAQQRNIFVDFTGTDWCTACIHLREKIVNSPEFEAAMGDKFVLVPVDFPRTPELVAKISAEEKREREALLVSFKIEGLPGVVLMDSNGLPFEVIHGTRRTPADYIPLVQAGLDKLAARNAALAAAEGKTGLERARAIDVALKTLPEVCRDKYHALIAEINSLDPENTLGYKGYGDKTRLRIVQQEALRELLGTFRGKFAPDDLKKSLIELDVFLAQPELLPEIRQAALRVKGDTYAFMRDLDKMLEAYKAAYEAAPESRAGKLLKKNIEYYETQIKPNL